MFKNIIAPVQAWLLSRGKCVGCGQDLTQARVIKRKDGTQKLVCKCGRIFIHEPKSGKYRRALFEEV
jgi:hypothetical protein